MRCMKKFKIHFTQHVEGVERCEAIVMADDSVGAISKFRERDFTTYLVTKQEVERVTGEDYITDIEYEEN